MDFDSTLGINTLGDFYQLIIVAVTLPSSITFSNQDNILFYILVSTIMVYVTRLCVVVTSSCNFSPDPPQPFKLIIFIFLHFLILRKLHNFTFLYLHRLCIHHVSNMFL